MPKSALELRFEKVCIEANDSVKAALRARENKTLARDELINAEKDRRYLRSMIKDDLDSELKRKLLQAHYDLDHAIRDAHARIGPMKTLEIINYASPGRKKMIFVNGDILQRTVYKKPPTETFRDWFYSKLQPKKLVYPKPESRVVRIGRKKETVEMQPLAYDQVVEVHTKLSALAESIAKWFKPKKREPVAVPIG